jgi:hypothetical protein
MRGLNTLQMAQMKHRDARVSALCQHLLDSFVAIDIWLDDRTTTTVPRIRIPASEDESERCRASRFKF